MPDGVKSKIQARAVATGRPSTRSGDDETHVMRGIERVQQQVQDLRQDPRARDVVEGGPHHASPLDFRPELLRIQTAHRLLRLALWQPRMRGGSMSSIGHGVDDDR